MLSIVLPKGSLEKATLELFKNADLEVLRASEVDYRAKIADERIKEVRILRPQESPIYVSKNIFDCAISGTDWIEETAANVEHVGPLNYSKNTLNKIRLVLAVPKNSKINSPKNLPEGVRVSTEYPNLTARYFKRLRIKANITPSYGATEAKIPEIADAVVEITETGSALRAAGLKIIDELLVSTTEFIASKQAYRDPAKRKAIEEIYLILKGAIDATNQVLLKLNISESNLERALKVLPAMRSPTISKLATGNFFAVETVVERSQVNSLIAKIRDLGATDIIEIPLSKLIR